MNDEAVVGVAKSELVDMGQCGLFSNNTGQASRNMGCGASSAVM